MATIQRVDGSMTSAPVTEIKHEGEEGARSGVANIDGKRLSVYNSIVDGFDATWYEQLTLEEWRGWKEAHRLRVNDDIYSVKDIPLAPGVRIRRWDTAAGYWFTGEVCIVHSFNHVTRVREPFLCLRVPGYAPSPLVDGDVVVIVSEGE